MKYETFGSIAQYARLDFDRGDSVWASRGSLMAYASGLRWQVRVPGGLAGAARRSLAGEGLSLAFLQSDVPGCHVLLSANAPGHIITWDLADGPVVATRGAFLAAWGDGLDITVTMARRTGAALFGGAGLFLQRVSGAGTVLLHANGDARKVDLRAGESTYVSTGNLAAFAASVDYNIETVGSVRNMLFGGEGLFMTRLTGPGPVFLQSLKIGALQRLGKGR
jgi:uncharacterized protein (TIGR00266 family)